MPSPNTTAAEYRVVSRSHQGRVRNNNEDLDVVLPDLAVFGVIDGVGGYEGGEEAARIALEQIRLRMARTDDPGTPVETRLREAVALANQTIVEERERRPELHEMACVLTVAAFDPAAGLATIAHVGDTRMYRFDRRTLTQVTIDHSPVARLVAAGEITEEQAMKNQFRHLVSRHVGSGHHDPADPAFIETLTEPLPAADSPAWLFCSDGLSDQVTPTGIATIWRECFDDPERAADELIAAANAAGGKDNVTVVLVYPPHVIATAPPEPATEPEPPNEPSPEPEPVLAAAPAPLPEPENKPGSRRRLIPVVAGLAAIAAAGLTFWISRSRHAEPAAAYTPAARILEVRSGSSLPGEYPTLAAALAAARPGETLRIHVGDYPENLTLPAGLTLEGELSRKPVTLDGAILIEGGSQPTRLVNLRLAGPVTVRNAEVSIEKCALRQTVTAENARLTLQRSGFFLTTADPAARIAGGTPRILHNEVRRQPLGAAPFFVFTGITPSSGAQFNGNVLRGLREADAVTGWPDADWPSFNLVTADEPALVPAEASAPKLKKK